MMQRSSVLLLLGLLTVFALACGDSGSTSEPEDTDPPANLVGPAGGSVTAPGLTLQIPAGALDRDVEIDVTPIADPSSVSPDDVLVVGGTAFRFAPAGLRFSTPATLTLSFSSGAVPVGVTTSELALVRLDGEGEVIPSTVDAGAGRVSGSINGFSSYAVGLRTSFTRAACPALVTAPASGMPLDTIALGRIPDSFERPLLVRAEAPGVDEPSFGVILEDEAGEASMRVPIHPAGDPDGGPVRLFVTDGTQACAPLDYDIDPLPAAVGELSAVVDLLEEIVALQAAEFETDVNTLVQTPPDDLPTTLIPLALLQSVLDHPDNDRSLRAVAEGTSSFSADARLDLVEPLLARSGFRSALQSRVGALRSVSSVDGAGPASSDGALHIACVPEFVNTAQLLDECMDAAWSAAFRGAQDRYLSDLGDAMLYGALVPGLGAVTAVGGAVVWVAQTSEARTAALLPSRLLGMELTASKPFFNEDEEGTGSWIANVTASNVAYDMGKELIEGALNSSGVAGIADKAQVAGAQVNNVLGWVATGPVANALLKGGTIDGFIIPPVVFGPVNVNQEEWSESEILGAAFEKTAHDEYEPRQWGEAILNVRTKRGQFGSQQVSDDLTLTVRRIQIVVSPDRTTLGPTDQEIFEIEVLNSSHPELLAIDESVPLQGSASLGYVAGNLSAVSYTAPADPNAEVPDELIVESMSRTGARANPTERRIGTATIRFPEVRILPRTACVKNGATQTFTATVEGEDAPNLVWEIVSGGGTFEEVSETQVIYTAPATGTGTVTLRVRFADDADNSDEVTFDYGACGGVALYRQLNADIRFPFGAGGACGNPDLDREDVDSNIPEDGPELDPLVAPPQSVVLAGRTRRHQLTLEDNGIVGNQVDLECVRAQFGARASYDAIFEGSDSGDRIDIDISTDADSECVDMGSSLGTQCSEAFAGVVGLVRFDRVITDAVEYRLRAEIQCDIFILPGQPVPTIDFTLARKEPDGTLVATNPSNVPFQVPCGPGTPLSIDEVLAFPASAVPGQEDAMMLLVLFQNATLGAVEGFGDGPNSGTTRGFISLTRQN